MVRSDNGEENMSDGEIDWIEFGNHLPNVCGMKECSRILEDHRGVAHINMYGTLICVRCSNRLEGTMIDITMGNIYWIPRALQIPQHPIPEGGVTSTRYNFLQTGPRLRIFDRGIRKT
eukprot:sb/3476445/